MVSSLPLSSPVPKRPIKTKYTFRPTADNILVRLKGIFKRYFERFCFCRKETIYSPLLNMSGRPVRYSAQEILNYLDGNFALLVPWVMGAFSCRSCDCDRSPRCQKRNPQAPRVLFWTMASKSEIKGFESNNDALGSGLIGLMPLFFSLHNSPRLAYAIEG